jgi:hypothetical protein
VSEPLHGDGFRLRRATAEDADFLLELSGHEDVEPFLRAVRATDRQELLEEIDRSLAEPQESGRFVIEVEEAGEWRRAGVMGFDLANKRRCAPSPTASPARLRLPPAPAGDLRVQRAGHRARRALGLRS